MAEPHQLAGDPHVFRTTLHRYQGLLEANARRLNAVNVYPVPDYDTGSNLAETMADVLLHLDSESTWPTMGPSIVRGALMGARGNIGVIFSQAIRGIVSAFIEARDVEEALQAGSVEARRAVLRPVEGTILSVLSAAAKGAGTERHQQVGQLISARRYAERSLRDTHRQLTLLNDYVVIDAGGLGFLLLLDAWVWVLTGRTPPPRRGVIIRGRDPDWRRLAEALCDRLDRFFVELQSDAPSSPWLDSHLTELAARAQEVRRRMTVETAVDAEDVRVLALHTRRVCESLQRMSSRERRSQEALEQAAIVLQGAG